MELGEGDVHRLIVSIEKLNESVDKFSSLSIGGINNSNRFSFGSAGIWICVTCVIVLFVSSFYQNAIVLDMQRKYDRMQDYLNAIYAQAPHLRPKDK